MSNAKPMGPAARTARYLRQNGRPKLTPAQWHRLGKKYNALLKSFRKRREGSWLP